METAYFDRFAIEMTIEQAESGSHAGDCSADVDYLVTVPEIAAQLDAIGDEKIKAELSEYGAWDETELNDLEQNRARIIWIACGNIREEIRHGTVKDGACSSCGRKYDEIKQGKCPSDDCPSNE